MTGPHSRPDLTAFSTSQLIEELARRQNAVDDPAPDHWCEECTHFVAWIDKPRRQRNPPDDYNPCSKRHVMRFFAPAEIGDPVGFYRLVCTDRTIENAAATTTED